MARPPIHLLDMNPRFDRLASSPPPVRFQYDPECNVLLMDRSGAVGLDLSFASWVFIMEPVADPALLEQVMGAAVV